MKEYSASNLEELLSIVKSITISFGNDLAWWRGHSNQEWKVVPSLFHKNKSKNEANMSNRFRNRAKVMLTSGPPSADLCSWLFLMQHHGVPTRLLDWTESALIALFFAVFDWKEQEHDASIWGLHPSGLNQAQTGEKLIYGIISSHVTGLTSAAFEIRDKHDREEIYSIASEHVDLHQYIQRSEFTIHGSPKPLEDFTDAQKFLAKIIIPKPKKEYFFQSLFLLGLSESYLFPDLGHLASELENTVYGETQL